MAEKKGSKYADLLFGKPEEEKAAFGVFPQMKPRRSKQDREAAKNVPVDVARGFVSGVLGAPGDIESLIRMLPGLDEKTVLPTSEDIEKRIPFRSDTPVSRAAAGAGQLAGGFYAGPGSPLRAAAALPGAVKKAGREFAEASSPMYVVKPKGGNWLEGSIEKGLESLKSPERHLIAGGEYRDINQLQEAVNRGVALNKWIDSNLANYIKKQMATPEDPVRKLAEEGIVHMQAPPAGGGAVDLFRREAGFPPEGMGVSEQARAWEELSDEAVAMRRAKEIQASPEKRERSLEATRRFNELNYEIRKQWQETVSANPNLSAEEKASLISKAGTAVAARALGREDELRAAADEMMRLQGASDEKALRDLKENPWISKLDPETPLYEAYPESLGFDHIIDVLREDLAAGRIRPEQLNKVSMEQAVRRTYEYDQEMAEKMAAANAAAREGLPVYKEYPEGYRWIELNRPGAFAAESEAMGHSVRGYEPPFGHPDWTESSGELGSLGYGHGGWEAIKSGRAKVYSLVDPKGEPHVTVEIGPGDRGAMSPAQFFQSKDVPESLLQRITQAERAGDLDDIGAFDDFVQTSPEYQEYLKSLPPRITQIKGKQNLAPKEEYLPYVQDFVRGGQWSQVGDLRNTGLIPIDPESDLAAAFAKMGKPAPPYVTQDELTKLLNWNRGEGELPEGFAKGGKVSFTDNLDTMRLELAGGGAVKNLARLLRAPAKSKQEIEAIAERVAPQVTGEYVRKKPGSAITVADKTKKQFEREKTLPVDIRATTPEREVKPVDIERLKDEVMIGIAGDPTVTGKTLYGVGDVRLESPAPQHGGPLYGLYHDDDHFWASGLGAARRVQNLAKEASEQYDAPVVGKYIMMGPDSINYALHFADANLQAIDLSKMSKKQIEGFNKLLRQGSPASGPRPNFPGIEDKGDAYLQFAFDPELRKHFNALMQQPTVTEKFGLPSGTDIRFAVTEPALRDLETGVTGYSMGRMKPEIPATELKLSEHPTYSHDIPGEFMGGMKYPVPYELSFPDTLKAIRENPKQAPHEFGSLKMVGPRQIVDQQLIDEIKMYEEQMKKLTGKKKGGAVKKTKISDNPDTMRLELMKAKG